MFGLGMSEVLIIALVIGILLFGSKKIVEIARSLGRFSGEFKKGKQDIERELKTEETTNTTSTVADTENSSKNTSL